MASAFDTRTGTDVHVPTVQVVWPPSSLESHPNITSQKPSPPPAYRNDRLRQDPRMTPSTSTRSIESGNNRFPLWLPSLLSSSSVPKLLGHSAVCNCQPLEQ